MKNWSNDDDRLVDMQQKIGEFGEGRKRRESVIC